MTTNNAPKPIIPTNGRAREESPPGSIADLFGKILPALDFVTEQTKLDTALIVRQQDLRTAIATGLRNPDLDLTFLRNMTAVDWEENGVEIVYHLYSLNHHQGVAIKAMLDAEDPRTESVSDLFMGAIWMEREAREMFGIEFDGLADARNLLLDEDIDIHPLRKSHPLAEIETPQGAAVSDFTKAYPPPVPKDVAADQAAASAAPPPATDRKSVNDMTPEELAERSERHAERVHAGRELAAARRAQGPATPMKDRTGDTPPAPAAPEIVDTPLDETKAEPAATSARAPAAVIGGGEGSLTDEEKGERVRVGRELAAARRAELAKERGE
jgi:NADH-quinone oxidoreductase subunit C